MASGTLKLSFGCATASRHRKAWGQIGCQTAPVIVAALVAAWLVLVDIAQRHALEASAAGAALGV